MKASTSPEIYNQVERELLSFFADFTGLDIEKIQKNTSLFKSGLLNSGDAVDLFLFLDEAFGV